MIDGVRGYLVQSNIDEDYTKIDGLNFRRDKFGSHTMNGSLHKFHNEGGQNADDYQYTDLVDTLRRLYNDYEINPEITQISKLEFGVNIQPPKDSDVVTDCVILFRNESGETTQIGRTFRKIDYVFKIYNKVTQSVLEEGGEILRVEVRIENFRYLKSKGVHIRTLDDLLNRDVLIRLKKILLEFVDDCLIIDVPKAKFDTLTDKEKIKLSDYTNPIYWRKIRREKSKNFSREKRKCDEFVTKIGGTDLKGKLLKQVEQKCDLLMNFTDAKSVEFFKEKESADKTKVSSFSTLVNSMQNATFTTEEDVIRCAGCGAIIPNPRKGQKFCSAKVVGYENAHRCRNMDSNPRNHTKSAIRRVLSIPLLFDLNEIIADEKRVYLDAV